VVLRKSLFGTFAILTIALFVIAVWADSIDRSTQIGIDADDYATESFEFNNGVPMLGNITLGSPPTMMESRPTSISYNISMEIPSETPMNLRVDEIRFIITPEGFPDNPSHELIEVVAALWSWNGIVEVVNASSIILRGSVHITPTMPQGADRGFLGCIIEFHYWEYGLPPPPSNDTSGGTGVYQMRPVTIVPAYISSGTWILAFEATLLVWILLVIYILREKAM
jgi:hypothetical protein